MAEVTWFKVLTDIFADDKIKILQSMPEGDSLLVMWFKVLSQAGKTNDGGYIYLKKNIPYTFGMFATLFGKQQQLVELAMRTFTEFGMIDIDDRGYVFVTNWEKHQSIDKLNQIKEKANVRLKKHRDKKRIELLESNVSATFPQQPSNATEIEVEVDLELDKENNTTTDDFDKVRIAYIDIHRVIDMPMQDSPMLSKLLLDGISPELIIDVMKEKVKSGVKTIKYYVEAIREKHAGKAQPYIVNRKREPDWDKILKQMEGVMDGSKQGA